MVAFDNVIDIGEGALYFVVQGLSVTQKIVVALIAPFCGLLVVFSLVLPISIDSGVVLR